MRQIDDELWVHEHPVLGIEDGLRMTIVRLGDGELWVHSPLPLAAALRVEVEALGSVRYLVSPNNHHHKWLRLWHEAYPTAQLHVSRGVPRKEVWLERYTTLDATPADRWGAALRHELVAGAPFFSETAFLHVASASLIVTDLVQNHTPSGVQPAGARVARALFGMLGFRGVCTAPPLALPWVRKDSEAFRASLAKVLAWRFERIVVCHGAIVEQGGHEIFQRLCARWL